MRWLSRDDQCIERKYAVRPDEQRIDFGRFHQVADFIRDRTDRDQSTNEAFHVARRGSAIAGQ
ncbi:MAG TPA: hypothetical protein VFJ88_05875, partial [Chthoniobacterales bacterium]|nr:hypothetical protein [Chthoniobacterales bacterium]